MPPPDWRAARERLRAPAFEPLGPTLDRLPAERWPTREALTELADGVTTSRGKRISFVAPRERSAGERSRYELRIADTGEIETRAESWHDLFNALAWIAYPRAKAAINAQHAAILVERGEREALRRSPERDALTLFDEGGVAVLCSEPRFLDLIVDFQWKRLFWSERQALERNVRFVAFGHALFEQLLDPHIGLVAKTVFLRFDELPGDAALVAAADGSLAEHFSERARFPSPRAMAPMPVLGIPGWHPLTSTEAFYDDPVHFRAKAATFPRKMEG